MTQPDNPRPAGSKPPADTEQQAKDVQEKRKHPKSENELSSAQDKNPVPPGSTKRDDPGRSR